MPAHRHRLGLAFATLAFAASASVAVAKKDWPMSLKPFGGGYPSNGDPCSKVGETAATAEFLDDSAILVACPATRSSVLVRRFLDTNGGRVVTEVEGFALISIQLRRGANGDAIVPGAGFHATGDVPCAVSTGQSMRSCPFGVIRKGRGTAIVKITWPDGRSRSIFFANGRVTGADTNQADGSAKHRVVATKELDLFMVRIGDERYEIPDIIVSGD